MGRRPRGGCPFGGWARLGPGHGMAGRPAEATELLRVKQGAPRGPGSGPWGLEGGSLVGWRGCGLRLRPCGNGPARSPGRQVPIRHSPSVVAGRGPRAAQRGAGRGSVAGRGTPVAPQRPCSTRPPPSGAPAGPLLASGRARGMGSALSAHPAPLVSASAYALSVMFRK